MSRAIPVKVTVTKDGPYVVSGALPMALQTIVPDAEGFSWDWKEGSQFPSAGEVRLCRCGQSKNKPFCDGSHLTAEFDGTETARRSPYREQAERIDGPKLVLTDAENLCAFARFCDPGGKIWALIGATDRPEARELAVREAFHCPGGRLVVYGAKDGVAMEPELPKSIGVIEDPALGVSGGLWLRGGVPVEAADGYLYETRNRVVLCRCGASSNKPFCDGSHASIKFRDGLTDSAAPEASRAHRR
jgi:CDGSH-type Zn-finger protein